MSKIQSIVFIPNGKNKWNSSRARAWLKTNKFNPIKRVDKLKSSETGKVIQLRYRIADPSKFKRFITKKTSEEINFIIGFEK